MNIISRFLIQKRIIKAIRNEQQDVLIDSLKQVSYLKNINKILTRPLVAAAKNGKPELVSVIVQADNWKNLF